MNPDVYKSKIENDISHWIDVLRGAAALGVIWGHTIYGSFESFNFIEQLRLNGAFWVWIFLVLSGYLAGKNLLFGRYSKNYIAFIFNRALRIVPLTYVALTLGLIIHLIAGVKLNLFQIREFLFLPHQFNMSLMGPLWTIAVEMQFYVFFMAIVFIFQKWLHLKHYRIAFLILLILAVFNQNDMLRQLQDDMNQPRSLFGNALFFLIGIIASTIEPLKIKNANHLKVIALIFLVFCACYLENNHTILFWSFDRTSLALSQLQVPLGGGALVAIITSLTCVLVTNEIADNDNSNSMFFKPVANIGRVCFGVYIFHSIILVTIQKLFGMESGLALLALTLLSVPAAYCSYRFFEAPLLKYKL